MIDRDCLALNARAEMTIQFQEIAGTKALIVDDVYRDPDYVRGLALSLDYRRRLGAYPGFFGFLSISAEPLLELVNSLMDEVVGDHLMFTDSYQDDFVFAVITKRGSELTPGQRRPHVDDWCEYAGIVYLNPPEQCAGGTSFWRHRATGRQLLESVAELRPLGGDGRDDPPGYLTESNATWELTQILPMAYNRLVFYNSLLLHSPYYREEDYGSELASRRLSQNLYFETWQTKQARILASRRRPG